MPTVSIGTFNLNNLFSRFNFKASLDDAAVVTTDGETTYSLVEGAVTLRKYKGTLVKEKLAKDRQTVADRIKVMAADVLAVQEVEDIDTLKAFAREFLRNDDDTPLYPYAVLIEGNDGRLIDVGLLSKLPLGAATSWQHIVHQDDAARPVFSRDLLEVEVYNASRKKRLLTIYNTHLKSHYVDWKEPDKAEAKAKNNLRRQRQAEMIARIIDQQMRPDSPYLLVGDMNDPVGSDYLEPYAGSDKLNLVDGLTSPTETRLPKPDPALPDGFTAWTHRYKESGQPARYELYDQIWLSPALKDEQTEAWIDRRTKHGGDGSDHDPAWVVLRL